VSRKLPGDTPTNREPGKAKVLAFPGGERTTEEAQLAEDFSAYVLSGSDIAKLAPTEWVLRYRIPKRGLTALYAPPKGGKTLIATELAMCAALGEAFFGEEFRTPLVVLYVAAERPSDVRDRIEAACRKRGIPMPERLHLFAREKGPVQVLSAKHLNALKALVASLKPDLIIFDTFAKMTLGLEENNSAAMGDAVEAFAEVVREAGQHCAGVIVHHAGKDLAKGLRGSTALLGAVDAVWKVEPEGKSLKLSIEAINAGPIPEPCYFSISTVPLDPVPGDEEARNVVVLEATGWAAIAEGIDADLVRIVTDAGRDGMTAADAADAYNEGRPSREHKDREWVSRRLKRIADRHGLDKSGATRTRRYFGKGLGPDTLDG